MATTQTKAELRAIAEAAIAAGHPITRETPKAETPKADPAPIAAEPKLFAGGVPLTATIAYLAPNPKKPGSAAHARYALYPAVGATLADALKAGVRRDDFLYDVRKGYLKVEVA